jgi:hypothetical protein
MDRSQLAAVIFAMTLAAPGSAATLSINMDFNGVPVRMAGAGSAIPSVKAAKQADQGPGYEFSARLDALVKQLAQQHPDIPRAAVLKALRYLWGHADSVLNKQHLAIVDFDRPSSERRLSLIRLADGAVESYLVAHGAGSGGLYATRFSDRPKTHESALGIYLTGEQYEGEHGRSLKLRGMEPTNDRAESRSIVMHSADYVTDRYVAGHGMAGRSWGCPAVDPEHRDHIMDALAGAVLLLYHTPKP